MASWSGDSVFSNPDVGRAVRGNTSRRQFAKHLTSLSSSIRGRMTSRMAHTKHISSEVSDSKSTDDRMLSERIHQFMLEEATMNFNQT